MPGDVGVPVPSVDGQKYHKGPTGTGTERDDARPPRTRYRVRVRQPLSSLSWCCVGVLFWLSTSCLNCTPAAAVFRMSICSVNGRGGHPKVSDYLKKYCMDLSSVLQSTISHLTVYLPVPERLSLQKNWVQQLHVVPPANFNKNQLLLKQIMNNNRKMLEYF
jgi:hypothetical protein